MKPAIVVPVIFVALFLAAAFNGWRSEPVRTERAVAYLIHSYNPTIGLCFDYPGSNTYFVSHDNILASYALRQYNDTIAKNITLTVKRLASEYNLSVTADGLPLDRKLTALLGRDVYVFNSTTTKLLASQNGSNIETEIDADSCFGGLEGYADMLCYASLAELSRGDRKGADYYYEKAKDLWDGRGFKDSAYNLSSGYETYKLGLFYMLNERLGKDFSFKRALVETVFSCQVNDESRVDHGGVKTHYSSKGQPTPNSKTNTETTSIIIISGVLSVP